MLLKCLMGFYKPDVGEIIKKQNVKIGYMPQSINVINTMPYRRQNLYNCSEKVR